MKQELHMITGKGGVGKSVLALALAKRLALTSGPTLLVELGEQSYFGPLLGLSATYKPQEIQPNLDLSLFSGESCLREYVEHLVKVPRIADLFFNNKVMRAFVRAAPGLSELAILGKLTSGIRRWGPAFDYRHIVVDAYSSGHFMALLKAPKGLAEIIDVGPMGDQSRAIFKVMGDSSFVHYSIVTLPEEMPMTESLELHDELKQLTGLSAKIFVNRTPSKEDACAELGNSEWELAYKEYTRLQNQKVAQAVQTLQATSVKHVHLPFILDVSARVVADQLSQAEAFAQ